MNPDRDPEVRNQCLLVIANLLQFIDETDATTTTINPYLTILINECILPNMQWKAGRTAAAIRATAIATLWSLFQAKSFSFEQVRGEKRGRCSSSPSNRIRTRSEYENFRADVLWLRIRANRNLTIIRSSSEFHGKCVEFDSR